MRKIIKATAITAAALAAWELGTSQWERRQVAQGDQYWQAYYAPETVAASNQLRQQLTLESTGIHLHIDIYPHPDPQAPVIIFNHGAAGYCRLFVELALALNARGYTFIVPDQRGQGFSGGRRGDYTIAECTQNILDVTQWARDNFQGPLYLMGGSVGGALSYYAAAAGAPVEAVACLNLFDLGNARDGLLISRLAFLADQPWSAALLPGLFRLLKPLHWLKIPFNWLGRVENLMDAGDAKFQARWQADPIPTRLISLRSVISNLTSPPTVPFEQNTIPTLVINQARDRMIDPRVTRQNYARLGGPKRYTELPYGHWSSQPEFWTLIIEACDAWYGEHGAR